jgi:hypothetical protein
MDLNKQLVPQEMRPSIEIQNLDVALEPKSLRTPGRDLNTSHRKE